MAIVPDRVEEKLATCQHAIKSSENNLGLMRDCLASYIKAQSKLSRKTTKLANAMVIFAETEPVQLGSLLANVSTHLKELDTHREVLTSRLEHLTASPLHHYPTTLGKLRADFKAREGLVRQVGKAQSTLDHHFLRNDRAQVGTAQVNLERTTAQLEAATALTMGRVESFEMQKRVDLKNSISEFIWTEMQYHAKSLEILSKAHQCMDEVRLEEDLDEIRERFASVLAAPMTSKGASSSLRNSVHSLHRKI